MDEAEKSQVRSSSESNNPTSQEIRKHIIHITSHNSNNYNLNYHGTGIGFQKDIVSSFSGCDFDDASAKKSSGFQLFYLFGSATWGMFHRHGRLMVTG